MIPPPKAREFLTPKEAAARFKVSCRVFYKWLRAGDGPAHTRKGNIIRIPVESFNNWSRPTRKGR